MKKSVVILIAIVLVAVCALSGCGQSKEALAVISSIDDIGDVTLDSREAIEASEDSYAALSEKEKSQVTNYSVLTQARARIEVLAVMTAIDDIGNVTLDSGAAIESTENSYAALSDEEKVQVTNYSVLKEAKDQFDVLVVIQAIDAIDKVSIDSGEAVEKASKAFEALTYAQQLTVDNRDVLIEKSHEYAFLKIGNEVNDGTYFVFSDADMTIALVDEPDALQDFGRYELIMEAIRNTIQDIHETLGLPDSLYTQMSKTSMLDGVQTKIFDYVTVSWSFSPGDGLSILYEFTPQG